MNALKIGECVQLGDGRIGRVRGRVGGKARVRVRRKTSKTHQFVMVAAGELKKVRWVE
jgi:hypothetical protein